MNQPLSQNDALEHPHPDSIVYLVQEPTVPKRATSRVIDTTPLLWWGKVRILMERTQVASYRPAQAFIQINERLKNFDPEKDYIAVAGGDSLAVIMVGAILAQLGHSHFRYLRFERSRLPDGTRDPSSGAYTPIRVPITQASAVLSAAV
ncbi:MAG: hypothetical protein QJR07_19535 [Acetobacteraceae bacterium]|nr:hypothetical protein [Acetobacteraceae bacterium]